MILWPWIKISVEVLLVIVVGNRHGNLSSNHEQDCISQKADTFGKGMHLTILPRAMDK